jgi:hypothetical protein
LPPPTERPRSGAKRGRQSEEGRPVHHLCACPTFSNAIMRDRSTPVQQTARLPPAAAHHSGTTWGQRSGGARSDTDGSSTTPARHRTRSRNPDGPTLHEIPRGTRRTRRRVPMPMPRSERERRSREGPPSLCREFGEGAGCVGPTRWPTTTRQLVPPQRSVVPDTKFCQGAGGEPFRVPLARHRKLDDPRRDKFG